MTAEWLETLEMGLRTLETHLFASMKDDQIDGVTSQFDQPCWVLWVKV